MGMPEQLQKQIDELRHAALASVRAGQLDEALAAYDKALALSDDDETRELLTINKADAMIAANRVGPEVQSLPSIVMRRRNLHHVYLAAYALVFKYRTENDLKRASFYGQIALQTAEEANQALWKIGALNELGVMYEMDSKFQTAIECLERAIELVDQIEDTDEKTFSRVALLVTLGYNKLLTGQTREGIAIMHSVIDRVEPATAKAEALIDLCYGYLDLEQYDDARTYGEAALELADEPRQIRNAHYLLGEAAYKSGDVEGAEHHFDELAKFYPEFRHLKPLLFAIDLRSMVNLKL
jgi:tetratricopeptide (TPR) repeat protein